MGVLNGEKTDELGEVALGGFLTVVGEDDRPSKMRSFRIIFSVSFLMRYILMNGCTRRTGAFLLSLPASRLANQITS